MCIYLYPGSDVMAGGMLPHQALIDDWIFCIKFQTILFMTGKALVILVIAMTPTECIPLCYYIISQL